MTTANPLASLAAANNLRPGSVIYRHCDFTSPPKPKFMVVVAVEPKLLVLMINSEVNQFFVKNGQDKFHVTIPHAEHPFLRHDSYANCIAAHTSFDVSDVRDAMLTNYSDVFKGWLTDQCLEQVYEAVKGNTIIKQGHQKAIVNAIEQQLPHLAKSE